MADANEVIVITDDESDPAPSLLSHSTRRPAAFHRDDKKSGTQRTTLHQVRPSSTSAKIPHPADLHTLVERGKPAFNPYQPRPIAGQKRPSLEEAERTGSRPRKDVFVNNGPRKVVMGADDSALTRPSAPPGHDKSFVSQERPAWKWPPKPRRNAPAHPSSPPPPSSSPSLPKSSVAAKSYSPSSIKARHKETKISVIVPAFTPHPNTVAYPRSVHDDPTSAGRRTRLASAPSLDLVNGVDDTELPRDFRFVDDYVFVGGTHRMDSAFRTGCGCPKDNGRNLGCEYVQRCDCLDDMAVDPQTGKRMGFPYYAVGDNAGCLRGKFLHSRHVIYECSDLCCCGPRCRNKLVQRGRQLPLEIFRTRNGRGWGLRCPKPIRQGSFIDTYRGEVITSAEADLREETGSSSKDSYLFSLDKFSDQAEDESKLYVVDGQYMGGPTRFINHSCDPNCAIFCVSTTRGDIKVYELAFFALENIPAYTELSFDYLDEEPEQDASTTDARRVQAMEQKKGKLATRCLCGSERCRGYVWL